MTDDEALLLEKLARERGKYWRQACELMGKLLIARAALKEINSIITDAGLDVGGSAVQLIPGIVETALAGTAWAEEALETEEEGK